MFTVKIRESIMIAHSLPDPFFGPAQNMHGATYVADVEFQSVQLTEQNVVLDIGEAKSITKNVLSQLNYQNLDELSIFEGQLTTTEFLAKYIHDQIRIASRDIFTGTIKVCLGETHDAWASYQGD
ncbi:6-pyruvoyl trahydropterin synthase family protein [Ningiella sp. W23]|uniref:6-pyruvoyl trahydropterin synthase family protein n=1 Tax=Ningiella sp. W23 TaxID=3023715 RepID=UPI003756F212